MHPGVVVLPALALALSALVAWHRRRNDAYRDQHSESRAILVYGLVATVFLWPALSIPDGIPSPSAGLFHVAPWQGQVGAPDPASGNGALTDVTYQIQPWLLLLRDQLRHGELPLWNSHSFLGQPFWANGQSAPLFPLHLLFAALPTLWGFLLLPWLRILVAALGTRRLALALGIGPSGALLAGLVFSLSGMVSGYLLFPMANALCLVPWVLWATERLAAGHGSARVLAACVALLALGGHPGTLVHCAFLSVIYLLVRGIPWRRATGWLAGWAGGGALAMVHLLPVALYLPLTARWGVTGVADAGTAAIAAGPPWSQVLPLLFRVLQPWAFGRAERGTWHGAFYEPGSRVFVGLVTLLLVLLALQGLLSDLRSGQKGDRRRLAVVVLLVICGLVAYRTPMFLQAVESLPVIGKALPHRLLFGVELCLALLAGLGLDRLKMREGDSGTVVARIGVGATLLLAGFGLLLIYQTGTGRPFAEVLTLHLPWLVWLLLAAGLLGLPYWKLGRAALLVTVVPVMALSAELVVAHAPSAPGLPVHQLYPATGATTFLAGRAGAVMAVGQALRPNTAIAYGLRDFRGDDPAHARRFDDMYRHLGRVDTPFFYPVTKWDTARLDAAGVRWVITPPADRTGQAREASWRLAYHGDDARVYERPTALPEARLIPQGGALELERPSNDRVLVYGKGGAAGRLVVAQAWAPGWSAHLGGFVMETVPEGDFLLAVDLPDEMLPDEMPVEWQIDFVYRPPGLMLGAWISAAALLWLCWPVIRKRYGTARTILPQTPPASS